jgi:glycosyltransferase involved in cell wall biosynthesis
MVTVGVVIPCRNEARWLHQVLQGLESQDRPANDVVVVDDGSTDETATVLDAHRRQSGLPLRIVAGPRLGVAAAVNTGVAALVTDIVVRLDGHCRPAADYLSRACKMIGRADVGVVGGVWTIQPGAATVQARAIAIAAAHPVGSGGALYRSGGVTTPTDVDTVPFGCFRRALWQDLSGLDERLLANEDYEFNYRVRMRGLRVVLDPDMRCDYFARPTILALAHQYGWYGWWKARMILSYPASIRARQLLPAMLAPALLALIGVSALLHTGWPLTAYPLLMLTAGLHAAVNRRCWPVAGWVAMAFVTMHLTWSAGFCLSMASAAKSKVTTKS